ncbi:MAG: twin-arginine translocation signal domain-containing protein, partial [Gemmatimonadaceae bacterium]|nr:twin-arginine translocation signal domain-containing protein [Gemmatimonadaceae bacterium]
MPPAAPRLPVIHRRATSAAPRDEPRDRSCPAPAARADSPQPLAIGATVSISRRDFLGAGATVAAGLTLGRPASAQPV